MSAERVVEKSGSRSGRRHASDRVNPPAMPGAALSLAAVLACSMVGVGCKSGTSMTKPSWWSFGGGGDTAKLAAAPAFSGDAKKPSESNSPYPTTSTPNGYVISGSAAPGSPAATPATQAAAAVGPVVYGSTPSPAAASVAAMPAASPAVSQPAAAAAQTGPYATLAGETIPPPGQPLPPIAPIAAAAAPAAAAAMPSTPAAIDAPVAGGPAYRSADPSAAGGGYSNFTAGGATAAEPPAARMADARAFDPAPAAPPAGLAPEAAAGYGTGRYATQSASRFSSGGGTPASPASYGQPPADAAFPPADAALPASSPPAAAPISQPGSPGLLPQSPSQPPVRRPDPGYRPFKTGSYRPSGTILADDAPPAPAAVRTASYEEPAATAIQR